jgi:two-component system, OmpR family, sensor kinase
MTQPSAGPPRSPETPSSRPDYVPPGLGSSEPSSLKPSSPEPNSPEPNSPEPESLDVGRQPGGSGSRPGSAPSQRPSDASGQFGAPGPFAQGTLGRRLVIRVTALVALVAILITAATALATRQVLRDQVDDQLRGVVGRIGPGGSAGRLDKLLGPGQPFGTLLVVYDSNGQQTQNALLTDQGRTNGRFGRVVDLSPDVVGQLQSVPPDEIPRTVTVRGLGRYRVEGFPVVFVDSGGQRGTLVVGIPMSDVDRAMAELLGLAAVLSLLAVIGTVFASRALVERSLRPLNRVAATAQQVSRLELDRGEVALAVRVPPEDTDPSSEVGRVGLAINHMLNNVAGALEARQASESKVRRFVADASHELRNPLAAIRGYAELTRRSGEDLPPDASYAISRVEAEAARMSRLVEDLLLLARLDSGPAIEVGPTDLTEIALNAVNDARAAGPDHAWSLSLPDEPVEVIGDRHRLHQVLTNLLANARTHTPPGTRVQTALNVVGGEAVMTVTDDGPGIPPGVGQNVFERFTRADTSRVRASGGERGTSTGLGLAIVAAVVEAHHGRVAVQSRPGFTEFSVVLPLAPQAAPAATAGS